MNKKIQEEEEADPSEHDELDDATIIKELTSRVYALESYQKLCERKILDIVPGHPLPIRPEHIGKGVPKKMVNELSSLRTKIEKLKLENKQLKTQTSSKDPNKRTKELLKENEKLSEALQAEIHVNKEQEQYIKSLSKVIQEKLNEEGNNELKQHAEILLKLIQEKEKYKNINSNIDVEGKELQEQLENTLKERDDALNIISKLKENV